jgi:hypothetical protein
MKNTPWIKDAQMRWFVLWLALVKFVLAIQQNIEYFTVYKLLWNKSFVDTVALISQLFCDFIQKITAEHFIIEKWKFDMQTTIF